MDIHQNQPVLLLYGANLEQASTAVILLHGRGSSAQAMKPLVEALDVGGISFLIPQATMNRWYPNSAFEPVESNQPDLSAALDTIKRLFQDLRNRGIPNEKILLGGFSQGACLAAEYMFQAKQPHGGLFVLSGALIGPRGTPRPTPDSFDQMPVFIGASDVDPWVPYDLIEETAKVFRAMGAEVDLRTYPGMAHTVNEDELEAVREMIAAVFSRSHQTG